MSEGYQLRRAIESLLRPMPRELRGLLGDPRPRSPIPGGRTVAVSSEREQAPEQETDVLWMEHGLMTVDFADLIAMPSSTGSLVHLSGSLAAYYAASGTDIPLSVPPRTRHCFGGAVSDPGLSPETDWPDGPPAVTTGTHPGLAGLGASALSYFVQPNPFGGYQQRTHPHRYTGPARKLMEALLGAGRTIQAPSGWGTEPGQLGLTQDPETGAWWLWQCGAGGPWAHAMQPTTVTEDMSDWLSNDLVSGMDADLMTAYVLAGLEPVGTPIELIPAQEMADGPYNHGATPIQAGWVWSASGLLGAIVTEYTDGAGTGDQASVSTLAELSIEFAGGVPSATLSGGGWSKFRPYWAHHKFWYGVPSAMNLLRHAQIWPGNDDCDGSAPVVCWYEGESLKVWKYFRCVIDTVNTFDGDVLTGSWSTISGGFGLEEPPAELSGSGTRSSQDWSAQYGGLQELARQRSSIPVGCCTDPCRMAYSKIGCPTSQKSLWDSAMAGGTGNTVLDPFCASNNPSWPKCPNPWNPNLLVPCSQPQYATNTWGLPEPRMGFANSNPPWHFIMRGAYADVISTAKTSQISSHFPVQIAAYLVTAPDVIWHGKGTQTEVASRTETVWKRTVISELHSDVERCDWIYGWNPSYFEDYVYDLVEDVQVAYAALGFSAQGNPVSSSSSGATSEGTWQMTARIAGQERNAGELDEWSALTGNGLEPAQVQVWAVTSSKEAALVKASRDDDPEFIGWDGPMPSVVDSGHAYALSWVGGWF